MKGPNTVYRKNFTLIVTFLVLVSVTLIVGLVVAYQLTSKSVEGDFSSKKSNVADQTISPYNDLYKNKIFEINLYSGLLDYSSAAKYADSVFHNYVFVNKIVFFQVVVGSRLQGSITSSNLGITVGL
jgi:two-component system phosphate regulon sensor histidine kinase PhoR